MHPLSSQHVLRRYAHWYSAHAKWLGALLLVSIALGLQACSGSTEPEPTPTPTPPTPSPTPQGEIRTTFISVTIVPDDAGEERLVDRIEPRPGSVQVLAGGEVQLQAQAFDQFGQPFPEAPLVWNTLNPNAGNVQPGGLFKASHQPERYTSAVQVSAAEREISLSRLPALATVAVEVLPPRDAPKVYRLRVIPNPVVARPRQIVTLNALAESAEGIPIDADLSWSLSTDSLGRINPLGYFTVMAPQGFHQDAIRVTARQGDQTFSESIDLQVIQVPPTGDIVTVSLLPAQVRLSPNQPFQFQALALDSSGQVLSSAEILWSMVDDQAGSIDERGFFTASTDTGVYANSVRARARHQRGGELTEEQTFATVVIREAPAAPTLETIAVQPSSSLVMRGGTVLFSATAADQRGNPLFGQQYSWAVADPRVGEIDPGGRLRVSGPPGAYYNAVRVTTEFGEDDRKMVMETWADVVIMGPLYQITVDPTEILTLPSQTRQLKISARDLNGAIVPGVIVTWAMADPAAGEINGAGIFVASTEPGYYPNAIRVDVRQPDP
ncbi:MAG: hypothetical protein C1O27_000720 [Chloroflexi bacterium]|jgi:hypothetical protein|nr:MAG: hypothetical protein C1O27_000720 [Chloroflexota bacterium]